MGQFVQDRPIFAGGYAATQIGLLVWHLVSWQRHATAVADNDFSREPDLRTQRNVSAALFYGALAASVVEAVVVGLLTGE